MLAQMETELTHIEIVILSEASRSFTARGVVEEPAVCLGIVQFSGYFQYILASPRSRGA